MPLFAPKYLAAHPFDLDHLPDLDRRVTYLRQWQANLRSGRIHKAKEEALQADFLNLLFGEVLGYDYQSAHSWHLEKEQKSGTDGTKVDGALGYFRQLAGQASADVRVVVELKDARTDLDKPQNRATDRRTPVEQAFGYASKAGGRCRWVIVSNFVELRLYPAADQGQYESFDLGTLPDNRADLARFFRLLLRDQLLLEHGESYTDHLYRERQEKEREISQDFYKKYKAARLGLLAHLQQQNPLVADLVLFNKAQKLLDRVVFICFCEDNLILPYHTFRGLLKAVREDRFNRSESKIYERVKNLFRAIDEGYPEADINRFNGGLFAPDPELDQLVILDALLLPIIKLEEYHFDSDLNVNILGHIFEQSIADIEELKAQLAPAAPADGAPAAPRLSKRKKDGIFYTPEYITRYMVREAVGGWLHARYQAAGLDALPELPADELTPQGQPLPALPPARKAQLTKLLARHAAAWQQYRQALAGIRVLDPACGSGAFLNQVFDYLHQEGQRVNRALARLSGGQTTVFDLDKHILTHNLFGVDLNAESVEITRLSLWLKTANRHQPLTALDVNIRTGNSLIADPVVAGELAFDWPAQFPEVMQAGGFDVVIGNPPYVRVQNIPHSHIDWFKKNYAVAFKRVDISLLFLERSSQLLKPQGIISFITSNQFISAEYGESARNFLLNKLRIRTITDFGDLPIFPDALTYVSIFLLENAARQDFDYIKVASLKDAEALSSDPKPTTTIELGSLGLKPWVLSDMAKKKLLDKIEAHPKLGGVGNAWAGLFTGLDEVMLLDVKQASDLGIEPGLLLPVIRGNDPKRFGEATPSMHVVYPYKVEDNSKTVVLTEDELKTNYPIGYKYLLANKGLLQKRKDSRKTFADRQDWYALTRFGQKQVFKTQKIVSPGEVKEHKFGLDITGAGFSCARVFAITVDVENDCDIKYALCILNSTVIKYFLQSFSPLKQGGYYSYSSGNLNQVPIPSLSPTAQQPFIDAADVLMALTQQVQQQRQQFLALLAAELGVAAPGRRLQQWDGLSWDAFGAELKKAKVVLTLAQRAEWLPLFQQRQAQVRALAEKLAAQDAALDKRVYALYQLTPAEEALVAAG